MSTIELIGAAVGGIIGVAAGWGVGVLVQKKRLAAQPTDDQEDAGPIPIHFVPPTARAPEAPTSPVAPTALPVPALPAAPATLSSPPKGKVAEHEFFDTKTRYLTTSNEFYVPLDRFYMYLMFDEEKEAFKQLVSAIDDLVGLEEMITARKPVMITAIPTLAQRARNEAKRLMEVIIAFNDSARPSSIKKAKMETLKTDIVLIMDEIVVQTHTTLAARPVGGQVAE